MRRPYLKFARRILATRMARMRGRAVMPYKLTVNLTNLCNSGCITCSIWDVYAKGRNRELFHQELSVEELEKVVASFGPDLFWLNLTGGEPTLKRGLARLVRHAVEQCPNLFLVNIPLNGILPGRTEAVVRQLAAENPQVEVHVTLSVDGLGTEQDRIRGFEGHWDRSMESWRRLRALRLEHANLRCSFQSTISPLNLDQAGDLFRELAPESDTYIVTFAHEAELYRNQGSGTAASSAPERARKAAQLLEKLYRFRPWRPLELLPKAFLRITGKRLEDGRSGVQCMAGAATITVDPYGMTHPCLFLPDTMGDLRKYDFDMRRLLFADPAADAGRATARACDACWINCEAIPSMLASPLRTLERLAV